MLYKLAERQQETEFPLYLNKVSAGFPSPAQDYVEKGIDLVAHLIAHPSSTYVLRVSGDSMRDAAIIDGSMLLVDFSLKPAHNDIVVASLDGEFTVKRLMLTPRPHLRAENPAYAPIPLDDRQDVEIVGVVTTVISTMHRNVRPR
ncbi:translesion error-prone DNA polymerase V autoproteolytic subunit [Ewingella allii]|uniref:translesion error-prone DNA polymerase V autoproteolytic subunit n=1 Tax=Ewingella allii TaxID=3092550 RepID=UPI0037970EE5